MIQTIASQSGTSFLLRAGERLKVIDPAGEQVADLMCYSTDDKREWLSSGRTIDYNETIYQTVGHGLYSNRSRVMLEILEDMVGCHDFLLTPCSLAMFHVVTNSRNYHKSCQENLEIALREFGIEPDSIPTTFNIFMNVAVSHGGRLTIEPPKSRAGDYVLFEAKMDLICALTACSDEQTNNGTLKPICYEIIPPH